MSNNQPAGISASTARDIANRAAENATRKLENKLAPKISKLQSQMKEVHNEMKRISNSIDQLGNKLDGLNKVARRQVSVTEDNVMANRNILAANAAGFTANVAANNETRVATNEVNGSVGRNTSALVEMEYLRLYNEARAPMRFVDQFVNEIDSRFQKAVENVFLNRELYDEHFGRIFDENENKVRTIGEHIFKILEEDFQPTVERRLRIPRSAYQELAMAVDIRRVEERSRQLDADLARLYDDTLVPLLEMHHEFEMELAADYAVEANVSNDDLLVPTGISINAGGEPEVLVGSRLEGAPDRSDGLNYRFIEDARYDDLRTVLQSAGSEMSQRLKPRELNKAETDDMYATLERLAEAGRIDPELLPGYRDYLDNFGLRSLNADEAVTLSIQPMSFDEPEPEVDDAAMEAADEDGPPPLGDDDDGPPPLGGDDDGPPPLSASGDDDGPPPLSASGDDDGPPPLRSSDDDGPPPLGASA